MPFDAREVTPTETYGAPESSHRADRGMIEAVDQWIETIHPDDCERAAEAIFPSGFRYMTTATRLAAHFIVAHDGGIRLLTSLHPSSLHYKPEKTGLDRAVLTEQNRLTDELVERAEELEGTSRGPIVAGLVLNNIDQEHFYRVWSSFWEGDLAEKAPRIAGRVLRAASYAEERTHLVSDLLERSLDDVFRLTPDELVFSLLYFKELGSIRDWVIEALLARHRANAAQVILGISQHAPHIPPSVPEATRLLNQEDPDNRLVAVGVALCLEIEPDYAIPMIVQWANHGVSSHAYNDFLVYKAQASDQKVLFDALASDALGQPEYRHPYLASSHHHLISDVGMVVEWLEANVANEGASRYSGALISEYLSTPPRGAPPDSLEPMKTLAHELYDRYGEGTEKAVLQENNLTDSKLPAYDELVAIALAKEVAEPSVKPDGEVVLRNIKGHPYTYESLGGSDLDKMVTRGALPWCADLYRRDLSHERAKDEEKLGSGKIAAEVFKMRDAIRQGQEITRQRWEERFRNINKRGVEFTPRQSQRLREDPYSWPEVRVLERLLPSFEVTIEPKDLPGLEGKRPEFLLSCEDGELILEVTTIGRKPEDVREGVKTSSGGQAKKKLQNKWREQFGECKGGIKTPVVIAVQPQWAHDLEFDLLNSLYGPQTFSYVLHKPSQQVVEEGTGRDVDKAFFEEDGVDCISAVAGISPEDRSNGPLKGELFRPLKSPRNPISPRMWVRLRTALYGPRPPELVSRISRIPEVTENDAKALVDYGVDDHSFFAAGLIPYPEGIPIGRERYQKLIENAAHLQTLVNRGRISDLRTAVGVDLSPLHEKGMFLLKQLLDSDEPPESFAMEIWKAMREEASRMLDSD